MPICALPGVVCQPELYQLLYVAIIAWAAVMLIAGLSIDAYRHNLVAMPKPMLFVSGLVLLSFHPMIFMCALWPLHLVLYISAPLGASIIATAYTLYGIWFFWHSLFGPEFRDLSAHR